MEDLLPDCAPEGTATPVFTARIARLTRRGRVRRWVARLLSGGRFGGRREGNPVRPPESVGDEGDGSWVNVHLFQRDTPRRPTPRTVRKLDRKRVTPSR